MTCRILGTLVLVTATASIVRAQEPTTTTTKPITFGVKAGVTAPIGDFGDAAGTGWHIAGLVGLQPAAFPLALRADVGYEGFGDKDFPAGLATLTNKPRMVNGTLNAIWEFPTSGTPVEPTTASSTMRPYIIGGVGIYHIRSSLECTGSSSFCSLINTNTESSTKFGLNAGGGIQFSLGGLAAFAEARWHAIFSGYEERTATGVDEKLASMIPISFGVMFR